jgi:predicted nucleic acid-binding protein
LTDDKKARRLAKQNKLEVVGTLGLVVQAAGERVISKEEALRLIAKLSETNFRATEAVFNRAVSLIKQITGSTQ